jgi:hypothetical protein
MRIRPRLGTSTLDLLVSFTLLLTVVTVATPLIVRHARLLRSQRDYRLALDELSNQMDRLTVLAADELPQAVKQLSPSPFVAERLAGAQISAELLPAESGTRITLKFSWNETDRARAPVTIAGWVFAPGTQPGNNSTEAPVQ